LRWIGGQPESAGSESAQWAEETKKQVSDAGAKTEKAQGQMGKEMGGKAMQGIQKLTGQGSKISASGKKPQSSPESTKSSPDGGDGGGGGGKKPGLGDIVESLPIE
jgi:defect-in-organelle-trafficking protein DotA